MGRIEDRRWNNIIEIKLRLVLDEANNEADAVRCTRRAPFPALNPLESQWVAAEAITDVVHVIRAVVFVPCRVALCMMGLQWLPCGNCGTAQREMKRERNELS